MSTSEHVKVLEELSAKWRLEEAAARKQSGSDLLPLPARVCYEDKAAICKRHADALDAAIAAMKAEKPGPVIVPDNVHPSDADRLYGEAYGLDWQYEGAQHNSEADYWQPIETAPTDGTTVLGCYHDPATGGWEREFEQWRAPVSISYRGFHPNAPGKKQWRTAAGKPYMATHWMPLPPPPAQESANG